MQLNKCVCSYKGTPRTSRIEMIFSQILRGVKRIYNVDAGFFFKKPSDRDL